MSNGAKAAATAGSILTALTDVNGELTLAIQIAGVVIPLVVGLVQKIKSELSGTQTIEYTVVLKMGQDQLDKIIQGTGGDLAEINAELTRLGLPTLAT
jgi:hypothetical protein